MTGVRRIFLPWYRPGLAAALTGNPASGRSRARLTSTLQVRDSGTNPIEVPIELAGPEEVLGLAETVIRRTEPFDGCDHAEPSAFAAVEFVDADYPWRFSPFGVREGGAGLQAWVPPWLALVVVPLACTLHPATLNSSARLVCDTTELPDPSELWAWAHVQVTRPAGEPDTAELDRDLTDPSRSLSRLLCPRRLESATEYRACLVPAFAAGRDAALNRPQSGDPLGPAWGATETVELPVYHTWTFTTSQAGSFEALARRVRPRDIPSSASRRAVDTSDPGWGLPERPGRSTMISGALLPITKPTDPEPVDPEPADPELAAAFRAALTPDTPRTMSLRPPIYGSNQHPGPLPDSGWLTELNLDARHRAAAGLGAWAVVLHQEELVDRAWDQLAAARSRSNHVRTAQDTVSPATPVLAAALTASLMARHGATLARGTAFDRRIGQARRSRARSTTRSWATASPATESPPPFAPQFPEPAYTYLRAVAPEWLLADAELPADTIALARTDEAFLASFLVGINDALARELVWRRFPVDLSATLFPSFWGAPGGEAPATSIAAWPLEKRLGTHGATSGGQLVLLVRGMLLRRFPGTTIALARTSAEAEVERLLPNFAGVLDPSTAFFGFPRTREQVQTPAPEERWWVVLEEQQRTARFGLDDAADNTPAGQIPDSWQNLSWSHVLGRDGDIPRYLRVAALPVGTERPVGRTGGDTAVWGQDAAHLALATARPPFCVRIPLNLWLPPT